MIISFYRELFLFLWAHLGFFGALMGISVIVSAICFPFYTLIGRMVAKENHLQAVLHPQLAKINCQYSDAAERQSAVERLYARYQYHPVLAVRKVLPLFVALPFLFLTYYMLEGTTELHGVRFLWFDDVGKADGLLWGMNLLPFIMTGINILTVYATPALSKKDVAQAWFIAIFFLVLLYSANAALMIYWCLNQLFNFFRSLYIDHWTGAKVLGDRLRNLFFFRTYATFAKGIFEFLVDKRRMVVRGFRNFGRRKFERLDSLAVALWASLFIVVILPIQTAITNSAELGISLPALGMDAILPFVCFLVLAYLFTECCRKICGGWALGFLTAVLLYFYLETGILAFDYPELNGETVFFWNKWRGMLDASVLPLSFVGVLWAAIYSRSFLRKFVCVMIVISSLAIFTVKPCPSSPLSSDLISHFSANSQVVKSCRHSSMRNVAVYVLDSIATPHMQEVFSRDPELLSGFDGFTICTNNIGMHVSTVPGVAGLLTGVHYDNPERISEYAFSCFTSNSCLRTYMESNAAVFCAPGSYDFGYSSVLTENADEGQNLKKPKNAYLKRMDGQQQWNLMEIVAFRLAPFLVKPRLHSFVASHWDKNNVSTREVLCFPTIAEAPIDESMPLTFQFWHTLGSHGPTYPNRYGVYDNRERTTYERKIEATWFVLSELKRHFVALKARGIYDKTTIIVTADHGSSPILKSGADIEESFERKHEEIASPSGRMLPILWFKPVGDRESVSFSSRPTSHAKIKVVLDMLAKHDLGRMQLLDGLTCSNRLYRVDDGDSLLDCWVDEHCNLSFKRTPIRCDLSKYPTVLLGHDYSLLGSNIHDIAPVKFEQAFFFEGDGPRMTSILRPTGFAMRVPEPSKTYKVYLKGMFKGDIPAPDRDGFCYRLQDDVSGSVGGSRGSVAWPNLEVMELKAVSDGTGFIRFHGTGKQYFELHSIRIDK